ncbi:hypothetical protein JAAARDRAFT_166529 [Jaapia argillacea MUCL 33604]|uniref:Peroxisomal membrane protein PEX14 n=1 Tax=Jaapia argillacea MUCL 33604 TaxID=933084 RepID=A0A067QBD1_9AGAM|nr:hypothetical protein JAAARDRAFT_166529 [Jaapia argillacea MUCL 33604]
MSVDDDTKAPQQSDQPQASESAPNVVETPPQEPVDRVQLLDKARSFLTSPQVRDQDVWEKRKFLVDKGLTELEIEGLMRELPPQVPQVPPRTYPQPTPSNLPNLLVGIARIFSWVAGGSAVVLFMYYRFLLPRLTRSFQARHALRMHHTGLMERLNTSLTSLKETQTQTFAVLPQPTPFQEDPKYKGCQTLAKVLDTTEEATDIPDFTLLRCALQEIAAQGRKPTTEELFAALEAKLPHLTSDEGLQYEEKLWQTLTTHPFFHHEDADGKSTWSFSPPPPPSEPPLLSSLNTLTSALPKPIGQQTNQFQHTLQTLFDLTGYISTQTYSIPSISSRSSGLNASAHLTPEEEEVRREIRALKGLVLNRRSFMPTIPRAASHPSISSTA